MPKRGPRLGVLFMLTFFAATGAARAQTTVDRSARRESGTKKQTPPRQTSGTSHKFLDGENIALFGGVAAVRALDFTSTQHFRERGFNEILLTNGMVDNKPLFATIEVAGTAASIGLAYLLHRTGHHRAERWVSIVHIGVAAFGDIRNYGLSISQNKGTAP
ncbi:MAG TPA: hypothetical protein VG028_19765 [Terriglobia bacterium]|nr:hypothetical protein [Terriglobia bacterium]